MRRILSFLMLAALSACAFPQTRWEKDGADEALTVGDLNYCRKAARDEAFATYPFGFGYGFGYGFHRWAMWDDSRYYAENRLTHFCMQNKGYQLVTVQPTPQTQRPVAPPSDK